MATPEETRPTTMCASCAGIQQNWRKAPGHAELVQGASRRVERTDRDGGGSHSLTVTQYRCDACGTRWNYENDKTDQHAGWSVAGAERRPVAD